MLSRTGEYALQAMVFLAQRADDCPIPASTIARATGIPSKYLSAILGTLVRRGVLAANPGRGGGFRFARPPQETLLYDVLAPFEPDLAPNRPCPFGNPVCSDDNPCGGHQHWKRVMEAYRKFLDRTTVAQVAGPKDRKPSGKARSR
ncbi:MAG: Rrf2 family transcriptional regulator [Planctomycetota bacterium]|nr:MAG: Rrf2 family transcriptional regulator [Planctomycetota bacterium]